jgi:hypothetical protein
MGHEVFILPDPRRRREDWAKWRDATGGAAVIADGVCVDREGTVDDLSEGVFSLLFHRTPARPESQKSIGHIGPTRQA